MASRWGSAKDLASSRGHTCARFAFKDIVPRIAQSRRTTTDYQLHRQENLKKTHKNVTHKIQFIRMAIMDELEKRQLRIAEKEA